MLDPSQRSGVPVSLARKPSVLLADDHHVIAEGLARLLDDGFDVVDIVHTGRRMVEVGVSLAPDVILSDVVMPDISGIDALRALRAAGSTAPVLFLSMHSEPLLVKEAFAAGATGSSAEGSRGRSTQSCFARSGTGPPLRKSRDRRPDVAHAGQFAKLTERQRQVLGMISAGRRTSEIAKALNLSRRTVESHRQALMQVLDVHSGITLIREAERLGLITD